jgi:metal-responsive CopG/Arc/MetJ family transcriptional regulator
MFKSKYVKIKLERELISRVNRYAELAGYSSPEKVIARAVENELAKLEDASTDMEIKRRLRGLGYIS